MKIYQYCHASHANVEDGPKYRMACPVDDDIPWIDAIREKGWDAAAPLFPRKWKWAGTLDINNIEPIADFSPSMGVREVLSPRAFELFRSLAGDSFRQFFDITVDNEPYWYVYSPFLIRRKLGTSEAAVRDEIEDAFREYVNGGENLPVVFRVFVGYGKRYTGFCTQEFKEMVEQNALTGLEFELFCEVL